MLKTCFSFNQRHPRLQPLVVKRAPALFCQSAGRQIMPTETLLDPTGFSCPLIRRLRHLLVLFCVCVCPPSCDRIHHCGHGPCPPLHISGQHLQEGKKK